jgi:hypothetical protein
MKLHWSRVQYHLVAWSVWTNVEVHRRLSQQIFSNTVINIQESRNIYRKKKVSMNICVLNLFLSFTSEWRGLLVWREKDLDLVACEQKLLHATPHQPAWMGSRNESNLRRKHPRRDDDTPRTFYDLIPRRLCPLFTVSILLLKLYMCTCTWKCSWNPRDVVLSVHYLRQSKTYVLCPAIKTGYIAR